MKVYTQVIMNKKAQDMPANVNVVVENVKFRRAQDLKNDATNDVVKAQDIARQRKQV